MPVETEIKLRWSGSLPDVQTLLEGSGYAVAQPRVLEIDQVYDREGELRSTRRLLRVRREGSLTKLTYKGPPQVSPHKSREELETTVGEADTIILILESIGFRPSFRYEKYRTTYAKSNEPGIVTVDETPIGIFLELEGTGDWIDSTSSSLGFFVTDYITASYASLYEEHRRRHPEVPADMRF